MSNFSNGPFSKSRQSDSLLAAVKGVLANKDKKTIKLPETITEEDILSAAMELRENAQTWEDMKRIINDYLMEHARKHGEKLTSVNATAFEREVLRAHNHKSVLKSLVETVEAKQEQLDEGYGMTRTEAEMMRRAEEDMMMRRNVEAEFMNDPFNPRRRSTPMDAPPGSPSFLPGFPGSPVTPAGPNPMNPAVQPGLIPGGPMVQPNPGQPFSPGPPPSFKDKEEEMMAADPIPLVPSNIPGINDPVDPNDPSVPIGPGGLPGGYPGPKIPPMPIPSFLRGRGRVEGEMSKMHPAEKVMRQLMMSMKQGKMGGM